MANPVKKKYYNLEEIIEIKKEGKPLSVDFEPVYPMLFTDPANGDVVEVYPTDVRVTIGHKIGETVFPDTTSVWTEDQQLIITTKDGKPLKWQDAQPYYEVILNVLQNTAYPHGKEITRGYVFRKHCISKPGCHFDWSQVSCTNIAKLDGAK